MKGIDVTSIALIAIMVAGFISALLGCLLISEIQPKIDQIKATAVASFGGGVAMTILFMKAFVL